MCLTGATTIVRVRLAAIPPQGAPKGGTMSIWKNGLAILASATFVSAGAWAQSDAGVDSTGTGAGAATTAGGADAGSSATKSGKKKSKKAKKSKKGTSTSTTGSTGK